MIEEYVHAAMEGAKYEIINDKLPYYGEIPICRGVWATGKNLEECRENLKEVLEGWILVRLKKGLLLPRIKGQTLKPAQKIPLAHA
ncbi:MAG: type II toxin-antitoxin system HicB family antitoxin [Elusimicrobia bacterium]|nr:type II toxin-antitoxin system HicB family antitoxin [Elusimicrobiota bacterium]